MLVGGGGAGWRGLYAANGGRPDGALVGAHRARAVCEGAAQKAAVVAAEEAVEGHGVDRLLHVAAVHVAELHNVELLFVVELSALDGPAAAERMSQKAAAVVEHDAVEGIAEHVAEHVGAVQVQERLLE